MLTRYHVKYSEGNEIKTFKVRAQNKQRAYDLFRKRKQCPVVDIINYDRFRKFVASVLAVVILISCFVILAFHAVNKHTPVDYKMYVVKSGDTLWDIAKTSNGYGEIDTRCIVMDMCEESDCESVIHSGDVVYVPVYGVKSN